MARYIKKFPINQEEVFCRRCENKTNGFYWSEGPFGNLCQDCADDILSKYSMVDFEIEPYEREISQVILERRFNYLINR